MKKITNIGRIALASMAMATLGMSAQSVAEFPWLAKGSAPAVAEQPSLMKKAPLNVEKSKGVYMFGGVFDDFLRYRHFASLYSNNPSNVTKLTAIAPDTGGLNDIYEQLFATMAGCYGGDGYYYAIRYKLYSFVMQMHDVVKVNPYTGEFITLYTYNESEVNGPDMPYEFAYNPTDGKIYALCNDTSDPNFAMTKIGTFDVNTGKFNEICSLNRYYFGASFDYDGNLYGVTWTYIAQSDGNMAINGSRLDRFDDKFSLASQATLRINGQPFKPYYQHSLEFDYTTGDLYWAATDMEHKQSIVRIDPKTAETTSFGTVGWQEEIVGLYIPFITADSRTAPARVSNLGYIFDPDGANKTTLTWTNPTTQWNRESLNDLVEVNVYRDDLKSSPVGTVDASGKKGESMTWTDESASRGLHKYYVVASSVKGERGVMDSIQCFVGRDLPGTPVNIVASSSDSKTVSLSWDMPTRGDSDGWFDKNLTYSVTRMPDAKVIASNISETSLRDEDIPEATTYTYHVTATNSDGTGEAGLSNTVFAGKSIAIPFQTAFETQTEAGRFTVIDGNADGSTFGFGFNTNKSCNSMRFDQNNNVNDDYLVSPPLAVKSGHTYRVSWTMSVGRFGTVNEAWYQSMRIVGGKDKTLDKLTDVLADFPELEFDNMYGRNTITAEFFVDSDEEYFVAFNSNYSPNDNADSWMYVENFLIEDIFKNDLAVSDFESAPIVSVDKNGVSKNQFSVKVTNKGLETQENYTVKVALTSLSGKQFPFAVQTEVPVLKHNESAVIKLEGVPEGDVENGQCYLVALVELDGDQDLSNNVTEPMEVNVDNGEAFNVKVTKDELTQSSHTPMQFYNPYSACQTIYNPEMLAVVDKDGSDSMFISRIAYEYTSTMNISDVKLKVYLGQTTQDSFPERNGTWIENNQTLVYEGTVDITKGEGVLCITLDDKFEFDPSMSLVVTVLKECFAVAGDFPVLFNTFDAEIASPKYHSMRYNGLNTEFDMANTELFKDKSFIDHNAPVLYLAVPGAVNGVASPAAVALSGVRYADGRIFLGAIDAKQVSVWSVDGKLVKNVAPAKGASSVTLDVMPGIYVVKVTSAEGDVYTIKVNAAK